MDQNALHNSTKSPLYHNHHHARPNISLFSLPLPPQLANQNLTNSIRKPSPLQYTSSANSSSTKPAPYNFLSISYLKLSSHSAEPNNPRTAASAPHHSTNRSSLPTPHSTVNHLPQTATPLHSATIQFH